MDLDFSGSKAAVIRCYLVPYSVLTCSKTYLILTFQIEIFGICGRPHGAWQIDPSGHMKAQAELFGLMGFDSVYFARLDYQEHAERLKNKTLEFIWRGNDAYPETTDLFTGAFFPYNSYNAPKGAVYPIKPEN